VELEKLTNTSSHVAALLYPPRGTETSRRSWFLKIVKYQIGRKLLERSLMGKEMLARSPPEISGYLQRSRTSVTGRLEWCLSVFDLLQCRETFTDRQALHAQPHACQPANVLRTAPPSIQESRQLPSCTLCASHGSSGSSSPCSPSLLYLRCALAAASSNRLRCSSSCR